MSDPRSRQAPTIVNRPVVARPERVTTPMRVDQGGTPGAMIIERAGVSTSMSLLGGERYVLGRHDAADVVFDDGAVSRLHGVLSRVDGAYVYEDYGSQNGSMILRGGATEEVVVARSPTAIATGDVLELGGGTSRVCFVRDQPEADRQQRDAGTEVSPAAKQFAERLRLAGRTRVPVFLLGPSGVGKTHSARRLHELSRLPGTFVPVNCARLPTDPNALHSELLGHVRGAFTGADAARIGKLVHADGGTLFLDEVESLPPVAQGFLLDVLEGSGDLAPLGAGAIRLKPLTFRLVSASKKPLAESGLRPDLCERLAEGHLWRVPGLAERVDDIPGLLWRFCREQSTSLGINVVVSPGAVRYAQRVEWPGQVRMLRATVVALAQLGLARAAERQVPTSTIELGEADIAGQLREREQVFGVEGGSPQRGDARRLTRTQVEAALVTHDGNQVQAAKALGISRNTLRKKLLLQLPLSSSADGA